MQLHRANGNDWDSVRAKDRNVWQQLAARTRGLVTPGNVITIAGALVVTAGLIVLAAHRNVWLGAGLILGGRVADLLDGYLADRTGTKSRVGEALDAIVDKLELAAVLLVLWHIHLLPDIIFVILALQALFNVGLSLAGRARKVSLHPSRSGKNGAVVEWIAAGLFIVHMGANLPSGFDAICAGLAWICFLAFIIFTLVSGFDYSKQVLRDGQA